MTKDNKHCLEHVVPAVSATDGEQTTIVIALDWLPAKPDAPGLWTERNNMLDDVSASELPTEDMLYSGSILWHGQQIKLRIMRFDCLCGLAYNVYVHTCSTSKCKS